MHQHRALGGRSGRVPALLSATLAGSLGLTLPTADAAAPGATAQRDHDMGSQIRRFEGGNEATPLPVPRGSVPGIDVSNHQPNVDWGKYAAEGNRFAYMKASEGKDYTSPSFAEQYQGSMKAGMLHGAYHYALPDKSSGAEQANYFIDHGGGWSPDGKTLPGAIDLEYNPYGEGCYGLPPDKLAAWIRDFSDTYRARTKREPVIYTSTKWFDKCVQGKYQGTNPLWIARYNDRIGELPRNWGVHTIWQHSSKPIDQDLFNGNEDGLRRLALGK